MPDLLDSIIALGYVAIGLTVFVESGLLVGFFLPGDSLLFTAGVLASQNVFNIYILVPLVVAAAILGDTVGYWLGRTLGQRIFIRDDSLFFRKAYVEKTTAFFERYGKKTIILARFVPVVRTFAPVMAGVAQMRYHTFLTYNVIGGVLWGAGLPFLGFWLGSSFPWVEEYLTYIILAIIAVSFLPLVFEVYRYLMEHRHKSKAA